MLHFVSYGSKVYAFCSSVTALLRLSFMFVGKIGVVNLGGGGASGACGEVGAEVEYGPVSCPIYIIRCNGKTVRLSG